MANRKEKNTNESILVKESNAIARAQLSPPPNTVWSERIIAQVAAFNRIEQTDFPDTVFMIGRLVDHRKKVSTRQMKDIEKAAESLVKTTFTVFYGKKHFRTYSVFSYIEYDNGLLSARLNPDLKPHYLELKQQFAMRSLPEFQTLTSIYSQHIYRYINSIKNLSDTTRPIEELHVITGAPQSITSNFAFFRRRVLDVAHQEINFKTTLKFDWKPVKTGRKVTHIRYVFGEHRIEQLEKQTEKKTLATLQTESMHCWEKHYEKGKTCKPSKCDKCKYCTTRGKMSFNDGDFNE